MNALRVTRSPLWLHPRLRPEPSATVKGIWSPVAPVCEGEPVLTPAGAKVTIIDTYGKRILLHGVAGYCWADPADLVTRPGT